MRYFMTWLMGFLPGIVAGVGLLKLFITFARKQCKYVLDKPETATANHRFEPCNGQASNLCLEQLCPAHCKLMHQEKCTQKVFRQNAA